MGTSDADRLEEPVIRLTDEAYDSLLRIIDEPMPEETRRLLARTPVWERNESDHPTE